MNLFGSNASGSSLSEFKDPFKKDCVERIWFSIRKSWNGRDTIYASVVYFTNGKTKGEQEIEADDFINLVKKTEDFVKSL